MTKKSKKPSGGQKGNTEKQNQKIFQGHKVNLWLTMAVPDDVSDHLLLVREIERKGKREKRKEKQRGFNSI